MVSGDSLVPKQIERMEPRRSLRLNLGFNRNGNIGKDSVESSIESSLATGREKPHTTL